MSNVLTKDLPDFRLVSPAIPAVPSVAPTPAYDTTVTTYPIIIIAWVSDTGFRVDGPDEPLSFAPPYFARRWLPVFGPNYGAPQTTVTHHPATAGFAGTPAVPAVFELVENLGWNASAVSIESIAADGQYQFSVDPSVVGVVTGLNDRDTGSDYLEIDYAFLFKGGYYYVLERGVIKNGPHAYELADVFSVVRIGTQVKYWRNATLAYTSLVSSRWPVFADCSLFFGGDAIVNASISDAVDTDFGSNSGGANGILLGTGNGSGAQRAPGTGGAGGGPGTPATGSEATPGLGGFAGEDADYASAEGFVPLYGVASGELYEGNATGNFPGAGPGGVDVHQSTQAFGSGVIIGSGAGTGLGAGGAAAPMHGFGGDDLVTGSGVLPQLVSMAGQFMGWPNGQPVAGGTGFGGGGAGAGGDGAGSGSAPSNGEGSEIPSTGGSPAPAGTPTSGTGGGIVRLLGESYGVDDITTSYAMGGGSFGLVADGEGTAIIIPPFAVARGTIMPAGFALGADSNAVTAVGSFSLAGLASDSFYAEARGSITPLEGYGYDQTFFDSFTWFTGVMSSAGSLFAIAYPTFGAGAWQGFDNTHGGHYVLSARSGARSEITGPLGTLSATGTASVLGRLSATYGGAYTLAGYAGASLVRTATAGTLSATAAAPSTSRLQATHGGAYVVEIDVGARAAGTYSGGTLAATASAPLLARLSKTHSGYSFSSYAGAVLSTTYSGGALDAAGTAGVVARLGGTLSGYSFVGYGGATFEAEYSGGALAATGTGTDLAQLNATHSGYALVGYAGASLTAEYSGGALSASATGVVLGTLNATASGGTLAATAVSAALATFAKSHRGHYTLAGYAGAALSAKRSAASLSATALVGAGGVLDVTATAGTLDASATVAILASLDVIGPGLMAVPSGVLVGTYSGGTLVATATGEVTVEYEAYSITLLPLDNGQLGTAATHYTTYPFDRIVRFHNTYYGVAADGLYELDGDDFDGEPIVAVVQTMEDDFERAEHKRFPALFLSGRVGVDLDVSVLSSEIDTDTYRYRLAPSTGASTHRVKFGRGIKANFVAYKLTNVEGEDFTIDSLMPEVDTLKRVA